MKALKWTFRYAFLAILISASIVFSIYCFGTASKISESINDISFIDLASESVNEAGKLIERRDDFNSLGTGGLIAAGIVLILTVLLIVYQVNEKKIVSYFKNLSEKKKEIKNGEAAANAAPPQISSHPKEEAPLASFATAEPSADKGSTEKAAATQEVVSQTRVITFCEKCGLPHEGEVFFCARCGEKIGQ